MTHLHTAEEMNTITTFYKDKINAKLKEVLNDILEEAEKGNNTIHVYLFATLSREINITGTVISKLIDLGYILANFSTTMYLYRDNDVEFDVFW